MGPLLGVSKTEIRVLAGPSCCLEAMRKNREAMVNRILLLAVVGMRPHGFRNEVLLSARGCSLFFVPTCISAHVTHSIFKLQIYNFSCKLKKALCFEELSVIRSSPPGALITSVKSLCSST